MKIRNLWFRPGRDSGFASGMPSQCSKPYRDPLSHPDLMRMNQRELADLQFEARCVCSE
ncbi:MAG: hypothetical protein AAGB10_14420 [Pseudomonadota bacterium]